MPTLGGRIVWDTSQLYTSGTISVTATYLAGDFNRDGHIDAADILPMEQALTNLNSYKAIYAPDLSDTQLLLIGDLDGDGKFTNADLQSLLNLLLSGGGSTTPVPEPSAFVLGVVVIRGRRRLRISAIIHP
ncbi:MAG TPA: dockerin type I domain-containing protein [Pirellulales bacterium]|nr:dockerin type I domain-containing protein [Pirellulales bacterium]